MHPRMISRADHCVLVADDHEPTRYALARALRAAGYKTVEAAGGAEALQIAEYVSAVVLDVHLPDLIGLEVCRLLRASPATAALPIVHMSAVYTSAADHLAGTQAGSDAYLVGPVDHQQLVDTIDRLLAERQGAG